MRGKSSEKHLTVLIIQINLINLMPRSQKKGGFLSSKIVEDLEKGSTKKVKKVIKTDSRASMILPTMLGYTFSVYNGKQHIPVLIREQMIGHKLGEFAPTRKFRAHKNTKKDKKSRVYE
jgi:small subunit ribosomal protein S19